MPFRYEILLFLCFIGLLWPPYSPQSRDENARAGRGPCCAADAGMSELLSASGILRQQHVEGCSVI
jgi:hypothetical protein